MSATAIAASTRTINAGVTKVIWCTSISSKSAPTRSEINAGTDLTGEVRENDGWQVTSNNVEAPDMDTVFTSTIPGRTKVEASSLTMYASDDGSDARSLMPRGTNGFVLWMDGGDVAGRLMDVYPVRVSSVGKVRSAAGDDPATITFMYAITSEPAEDVTIPS
jgi:hypothetical protein